MFIPALTLAHLYLLVVDGDFLRRCAGVKQADDGIAVLVNVEYGFVFQELQVVGPRLVKSTPTIKGDAPSAQRLICVLRSSGVSPVILAVAGLDEVVLVELSRGGVWLPFENRTGASYPLERHVAVGLRNLPYFWWNRLVASDAGLVRLTSAVRVTASVVLAFAIIDALTTVTALPRTMVVMGVIESLFGSVAVRDPSPAEQRLTLMLTPFPAAVALTLGTVLSPWRAIGDGIFLVVIFAAAYSRRFGPRATALGMLAYISYFIGVFLHLPLSHLPYQMLALAIGTAAAYIVRFVIFRDRPERTLKRVLNSFYRRIQQMLDEIEAVMAVGVWDDSSRQRLRHRVSQINETALAAEGQMEALDPSLLKPSSRHGEMGLRLFDLEVAAGRLVDAAASALPHQHECRELRLRLDGSLNTLNTPGPRRRTPFASWPRTGCNRAGGEGGVVDAIDHLIEALDAMPPVGSGADTAGAESRSSAPRRAVAATSGLLPTTRAAIQVTVACALAIIPGEFLSTHRWYWAVITVFVMFTGTQSRGDVFDKGIQRVAGTLAGVGAGILIATAVSGDYSTSLALIFISVFLGFYLLQVAYGLMIFWITIMISMLYGLLGTFTPALLLLRIEETVIGAVVAVAVAMFLLPTSSREKFRITCRAFLQSLRILVGQATQSPTSAKPECEDLTRLSREIDRRFYQLEAAGKPLTGGRSGGLARTSARRWIRIFMVCGYYARELASPGQITPPTDDRNQTAEYRFFAARIDARISKILAVLDKSHTKAALPLKDEPGRVDPSAGDPRERTLSHDAPDNAKLHALARIDGALRHLMLDPGNRDDSDENIFSQADNRSSA